MLESGPRHRTDDRGPSKILYVDVDSLRPDHLGCYGYERDTSPVIDDLASAGMRFTNYYATDAPCLPSRTALFSSQFGIHTGAINHGALRPIPPRRRTSPTSDRLEQYAERLRESGRVDRARELERRHG